MGLVISRSFGGAPQSDKNISPIKQPIEWLPIAMSLAAFALVLGHVAIDGAVHEADEGTPAHIFQILIAAQVPIIAFFALKWLPQNPRRAFMVWRCKL